MSKELILESTTLWDYPTQNYSDKPHGNNKYNGVTPAFVIWNLLQRYTKEGDLVVDPMAGSGTTIDVAKELNRKAIGYDLNIVRPDIIKTIAVKFRLWTILLILFLLIRHTRIISSILMMKNV